MEFAHFGQRADEAFAGQASHKPFRYLQFGHASHLGILSFLFWYQMNILLSDELNGLKVPSTESNSEPEA
jgi:hypothetical protein